MSSCSGGSRARLHPGRCCSERSGSRHRGASRVLAACMRAERQSTITSSLRASGRSCAASGRAQAPYSVNQRTSWQNTLDRHFAEGLEWATWAVSRWDVFPVDQQPRPLVLVGQRAFVEHGFATGEAKIAYLSGQIESAIPVPERGLRALPRAPNTVPSGRPAAPPLLIQSATHSETEFLTEDHQAS